MIRITARRANKGSRQRVLAEGPYSDAGWSASNQSQGREGNEFFSLALKDDKQGNVTARMTRADALRLVAFVLEHERQAGRDSTDASGGFEIC